MKIFFISYFFFISCACFAQVSQVKDVISRMLKANDKLNSAKFTLYTEERLINGKFAVTERFVKLKTRPKQIYLYSIKPNSGTEILWKEGSPENKMIVSPGSFPFITFKMKPNSSLARKDSHHPIYNLGFEYVTEMMKYYLKNYGDRFYDYIKITDTLQWDNHSCIVVSFDFKDYAPVNYTVKKNEHITDIAERFHLNDYSILLMNPTISSFDDVEDGQVIKIPNFYNKKIEFYIDRATWLPLKQFISDQKGVYEKYEMKSFLFNPVFKPDEFSTEFKGYKF